MTGRGGPLADAKVSDAEQSVAVLFEVLVEPVLLVTGERLFQQRDTRVDGRGGAPAQTGRAEVVRFFAQSRPQAARFPILDGLLRYFLLSNSETSKYLHKEKMDYIYIYSFSFKYLF